MENEIEFFVETGPCLYCEKDKVKDRELVTLWRVCGPCSTKGNGGADALFRYIPPADNAEPIAQRSKVGYKFNDDYVLDLRIDPQWRQWCEEKPLKDRWIVVCGKQDDHWFMQAFMYEGNDISEEFTKIWWVYEDEVEWPEVD